MKTMGTGDDVGVAGVQAVIGVLSLMDGIVALRLDCHKETRRELTS
jgi:hypothetical protein